MSSFIQNLIILGGVVVLIAFGYYLYTQENGAEADSELSAQVAAESANFLHRLNELKAIELDGSIFSDPRFVSLVNYSLPIVTEAVGNPAPFDRN